MPRPKWWPGRSRPASTAAVSCCAARGEQVPIELPLRSPPDLNALAAATLALAAGATLQHVADGLKQAVAYLDGSSAMNFPAARCCWMTVQPRISGGGNQLLAARARRAGTGLAGVGRYARAGIGAAVLHAEVGQRAREPGWHGCSVWEDEPPRAQAFGVGGEHFADQTAWCSGCRRCWRQTSCVWSRVLEESDGSCGGGADRRRKGGRSCCLN